MTGLFIRGWNIKDWVRSTNNTLLHAPSAIQQKSKDVLIAELTVSTILISWMGVLFSLSGYTDTLESYWSRSI